MLLQKRLGHGSRGHQVPATPRVPTLALGKRFSRREKNEMCALDLLATVAGTLLPDQENSSSRPDINGTTTNYATNRKSVEAEQFDEALPFKSMAVGKDGCKGCTVGYAGVCPFLGQTDIRLAENSLTQNVADTVLESLTEKPDVLVKGSLVSCTKPCRLGHGLRTIPEYGTIGVCCPWSTGSKEVKQVSRARPTMIRSQVDSSAATLHSLVDTMDLDTKPPSVVSSDGSSGVHLGGHGRGHNSSPLCCGKMQQAVDRDDDENSSGCVDQSTSGSKGGYMPQYIGYCRIRRLFATRLRKAASNKICREKSNKGSELNVYGKKISATRQMVQRTMFKRKRLVHRYFAQSSDEGILTETSRTSFCMGGPDPPCASEGYHVKLTIKSFNIPELLIGIPENATIGSLKRIVADAVTTTIEGGLRVGVLLQGNNIQDDSKTLHQAGICHGAKLDNVGFTLESEAGQDSHSAAIAPEEMDSVGASVVEPLSMMKCEQPFPETWVGDDNQQPMQDFRNCNVRDPGDYPAQAIVPVATPNVDEMTIVPLSKSKRLDFGQRRTRRPFSVSEVEALVEAIEQLGTGRWKDVKFHAFENADHRTYVDLKDKWKTLVHTASIPPQQRRGKVIPQELLDRVLAAQAYWSQQQAKLQDNLPIPEICLA